MKIDAEPGLAVGLLGTRMRQQLYGTVVVRMTCALRPDGIATMMETPSLSGDLLDDANNLLYPSDFVPIKTKADVCVVSSAYAPNGEPASFVPVSMRVGTRLRKALVAAGDRPARRRAHWAEDIRQAVPFLRLPLRYDKAYGGVGHGGNPSGIGFRSDAVPNIEDPALGAGRRAENDPPAGFGPVPAQWAPRKTMVGTYDNAWLKQHWPWFPEDFDWRYFNAAPQDQQIEGYLQGDETLEFENQHPLHAVYRSTLPGVRCRCFAEVAKTGKQPGFNEVPMRLDTLWVDLDAEVLVLVWRGLIPVSHIKLKELERIFVLNEPLSEAPKTVEACRRLLAERSARPVMAGIPAMVPPPGGDEAAFAQAFADVEKEAAQAEVELAAAEAEAAKHEGAADKTTNDVLSDVAAKAPAPASGAAESPQARLRRAVAEAQGMDDTKAAELKQALADLDQAEAADADAAAAEAEADALEASFAAQTQAMVGGGWTRASVEAALAKGTSFAHQNLIGLDLAGLNFSAADLTGAVLAQTRLNAANFAGAQLQGGDLSGADLTRCNLTGANLDAADFTGAILAHVRFAGASLNGAVLRGQALAGVDFSQCVGREVDFSMSQLTGAIFVSVRMPRADFTGSRLQNANFTDAVLQDARFDGAAADGIRMERADLTRLRATEGADFRHGVFRGVSGNGSLWEQSTCDGADFSGALLNRAQFSEARLRSVIFDGAQLRQAVFDDAVPHGAVLTRVDCLRATFDRADMTRTDARASNFFEAGFWDTVLQDTRFDGANLKRSLLAEGHGTR